MNENRKLRVFLCHADADQAVVRDFYQRLYPQSWIQPWLAENELLPGQDWNLETEKAVEAADVILILLSKKAITSAGQVQRELKLALDLALEKPAGAIFIIPVRLEVLDELPRSLRALHPVDYFPQDQRAGAAQTLLKSLKARADALGILAKERKTPSHAEPTQGASLFISYSRTDSAFVDKLEAALNEKGIRFWRDIHDATSGRLERQVERAMRQNPTVLLVLSANSIQSDWVEHEVREARGLEKELGRDVLCPVALDDGWKRSPWPQRVMEQVMEYNILDFSQWEDESAFQRMFARLLGGLELFYKE